MQSIFMCIVYVAFTNVAISPNIVLGLKKCELVSECNVIVHNRLSLVWSCEHRDYVDIFLFL